ncbi:MAG: M1 family metallopeptidase [Planctomycetota bacterium]
MLRPTLLAVSTLLAVASLAGQAPNEGRVVPYPIDLPDTFAEAIERGTRTANGRPGARYWTNHAHYRIEAKVDVAAARVTGTARLTYRNRSPVEIDRLVLHAYQDLMKAGAQRTRTVTATPGFELGEVRLAGKPVRSRVVDTRFTVRLQESLQPNAEVTIEVDWAFAIPKAGTAPRMGHEADKVVYLGYWYPQFAVFDDVEGWVADPHRGNGEFYMDYADYELAITAPQGYLVRATGELQNADQVLTEKARAALATAMQPGNRDVVHVITKEDHEAGTVTAPSADGWLTWRFRAETVRDVAVSVARTYLWDATHAVVKDKLGAGQDGICAIHAVYEPNSGDWVRAAEYARHTIEYMSVQLHPYPWPHMTCCEGIIGGGMEYPMMTIVGGRQPAETIVHELIHMWFPMLLGSNEKRYAWQDEGLTSFWTTLCYDALQKRSSGAKQDVMMYAANVRSGGDTVCMRHADTYGQDDFGFASYTKPAAVFHQLRALLGDDVFFAAFRRYAADWAMKHPYPYDLFRTFADVAGQDLEPYFRTWLFEAWRLEHALGGVDAKDDATLVTVVDRGRAVHPCTVQVTFADGGTARQVVPSSTWQQQRQVVLKFGPGATKVVIDPDLATLDVDRKNNSWTKPD